jgi:hypothetical protein
MDNTIILGILIPISIILYFISGFSKSICDLSEEGKLKFTPENIWIKSKSSSNKYKNGDKKQGPAFFLSTSVLVMFTDKWHEFGFYEWMSFGLANIIIGFLAGYISLWFLFGFIIGYIFSRSTFHLFHDTLNILKK